MNAKDGGFEHAYTAVTSCENACDAEFAGNGEWSVAKPRHHDGKGATL